MGGIYDNDHITQKSHEPTLLNSELGTQNWTRTSNWIRLAHSSNAKNKKGASLYFQCTSATLIESSKMHLTLQKACCMLLISAFPKFLPRCNALPGTVLSSKKSLSSSGNLIDMIAVSDLCKISLSSVENGALKGTPEVAAGKNNPPAGAWTLRQLTISTFLSGPQRLSGLPDPHWFTLLGGQVVLYAVKKRSVRNFIHNSAAS